MKGNQINIIDDAWDKVLYLKGLSYDDVLLIPQKGVLRSRSEADLSTHATTRSVMEIPIVSAPMSTVTEVNMAIAMAELGGLGIIHRNMTIETQVDQWNDFADYMLGVLRETGQSPEAGCAVGVTEDSLHRLKRLYDNGCRIFCVDIAHGHSIAMEEFLSQIPSYIWEDSSIIVGSVASSEAIEWLLERFDIGAFRVGIGSGAACTTRRQTGFGVPQFTAVLECSAAAGEIPVIADGGIKNSGDIVKALAAGASSVMLGRLLACAKESPRPGEYYGMASYDAHKERGKDARHIEGESGKIEITGSAEDIINELLAGVRSGLSYGGAHTIKELQQIAKFRIISEGVLLESGVRI